MALQSFVVLAMLFASSGDFAVSATGDAVQTVLGDGKVQCRFSNGDTKVYAKDCPDELKSGAYSAGPWERRAPAQSQPAETYTGGAQPDVGSAGLPGAPGGKGDMGYGNESGDGASGGYDAKPAAPISSGEQPHSQPANPNTLPTLSPPADNSAPPCCEELQKGAGGWTLVPPASTSAPPTGSPSEQPPPNAAGGYGGDKDVPGPAPLPDMPAPEDSNTPNGKFQQPPQPYGDDHHSDSRGSGDTTISSLPKDTPAPITSGNDNNGGSGSDVDESGMPPADKDCDKNKDQPKPEEDVPAPVPSDNGSPPASGSPDENVDSPPKHAHKHKHHHDEDSPPPTWAVDVPEYRNLPASPGSGASTPTAGGHETPSSPTGDAPSLPPAKSDQCSNGQGGPSCGDVPGQSSPEEDSNSMCGPAVPYGDLVHLFVPASNDSSYSASPPAITSGGAPSISSGGGSVPASSPEMTTPPAPVGINSGGGSVPGPAAPADKPVPAISSGGAGVPPPSGGVSASGLPPAPASNSAPDAAASPKDAPKTRIGVTTGDASTPAPASSPSDSAPAITSGGAGSPSADDTPKDSDTCPANSVSKFEFKTCEFVALVQRMQLSEAQLAVFGAGLKAMMDNSLASYSVDSSGTGTISPDSANPSVKSSYLNGPINESINKAMGDLKPASPAKDDNKSPDAKARDLLLDDEAGEPQQPSVLTKRATSRLLRVVRRQ